MKKSSKSNVLPRPKSLKVPESFNSQEAKCNVAFYLAVPSITKLYSRRFLLEVLVELKTITTCLKINLHINQHPTEKENMRVYSKNVFFHVCFVDIRYVIQAL